MSKLSLINVNSFKFVVIIPAAGTSERFNTAPGGAIYNGYSNGSSSSSSSSSNQPRYSLTGLSKKPNLPLPKQYSIICNKPLIYHTVASFLKLKWIDHIIVIASIDLLSKMEEILSPLAKQQQKRFDCIAGANTRHRSIRCGLDFLEQKRIQPDFIVIHDGARPYLDEQTLHKLVDECYKHGVSGVYCPLTSTVIRPKTDHTGLILDKVLDRSQHVASETPQAFRYNLLVDAYGKCTEDELDHGTECLELVRRYTKFAAKLLPVDPTMYFKVTYKKDLHAADNILKEQRNILLHCDFDSDKPNVNYKFIKELKDDLVKNFADVKYFSDSAKIKSLVQHSYGTVHVLLHYCDRWDICMQQNLASYENLVYIVANNDATELTDNASSTLIQWSRSVKSKDIKNFYLIFTHVKNLEKESLRIRNIVVYLSKELPMEFSGQTFFI